jgi:hypothetical protein
MHEFAEITRPTWAALKVELETGEECRSDNLDKRELQDLDELRVLLGEMLAANELATPSDFALTISP